MSVHELNPNRPLRLVVVSAGLGVPSSTRLLADRLTEATRAESEASGRPLEETVIELSDLAIAVAKSMVAQFYSPELGEAIDAVESADGLIAVTPVFTASFSGLFKSFFDVIDNDALTGKPVLLAASGGTGRHSLVLEHALRPMFAYLRAEVTPTAVYAAPEDWGSQGDPLTEALPVRIARAGRELARQMTTRPAGGPATVASFAERLQALELGTAPRTSP